MKKILVLLSIACVLPLTASFAQVSNAEIYNPSSSLKSFDTRFDNVKGTIYIHKDFRSAKISNLETIFNIRYDAYSDEMEIEQEDSAYYLLKKQGMQVSFLGTNEVYKLYDIETDQGTISRFVLVAYEGSHTALYIKQGVVFTEAVKPKTGYDKAVPPMLKREKDVLYMATKKGIAIALPKKKKEILALFKSKENEISEYIKKSKLSLKKKEDLVKIIGYYDSLF